MSEEIEVHPIQGLSTHAVVQLPKAVTMAAYEVYCHIYGKQEAMVTGGCRGGFATGEIIAFLYARPFPKAEWSARVQQAFAGMKHAMR